MGLHVISHKSGKIMWQNLYEMPFRIGWVQSQNINFLIDNLGIRSIFDKFDIIIPQYE